MIIYGEYEGRDRGTEVGAVIDATLVKRASSGSEGSGYVMHRGNGSYVLPANKMGPPRWFFFRPFSRCSTCPRTTLLIPLCLPSSSQTPHHLATPAFTPG